jgi:flagellin
MSRINTNIPSIIAARVLGRNNTDLSQSLNRLSTGLRINTGKDDPAGLIASEVLRGQAGRVDAAVKNAQRADQVIATADAALGEVNALLVELEGLVTATANEAALSDDEVAANQLQVDSILDSINRISNSSSFADIKLLNGELDYTLSGTGSNITDATVTGAKLAAGTPRTVIVEVTQSALQGELAFSGAGLASSNTVTIEVAGNLGAEILSFAGSTAASAISFAVNQVSTVTGVTASSTASSVTFNSIGFGTNSFVGIQEISGTFAVTGGAGGKDFGQDAGVTINGNSATTDGLSASTRTTTLAMELELSQTFGTTLGTTTFAVVSGGANFAISPDVNSSGTVSIGIQSVSTASLGNTADGRLSTIASGQANSLTSKNFGDAQRIVRESSKQVSTLRGRLGAFQKNTLSTTMRALQVAFENITAAESAIRDTDFAMETSRLTRNQILVQAGTRALALANQQPQNALALLP